MEGTDSFEVELTSTDAPSGPTGGRRLGRRRRRGATGDGAAAPGSASSPSVSRPTPALGDVVPTVPEGAIRSVDVAPSPSPAWVATERGRLIATGVVVGVLALLLGWMVGRSGEDPASVADDAPSTTTRRSSLPLVEEPIGTADFDDPEDESSGPATTRPARTTTTLPSAPVVEPIEIDPRLAGTPLRLVGIELGGKLIELDLQRGTRTEYPVRNLSFDGSTFVAGDDWVLTSRGDRPAARVIRSDGSETEIEVGQFYWRAFPVPGRDTVWGVFEQDEDIVLREVGLDDTPTGAEISLPFGAWPAVADPATGGIVTQSAGRVYVVGPDGVTWIGDGDLLALSSGVAAFRVCDDVLTCRLAVVDRATGATRTVDVDDPGGGGFQPTFDWSSGASVSPDDRWLAVSRSTFRSNAFGLVDLLSGEYFELARDLWPTAAVWTPDGSHVIYLAGDLDGLRARDLSTGEDFPVTTETLRWTVVTARPT